MLVSFNVLLKVPHMWSTYDGHTSYISYSHTYILHIIMMVSCMMSQLTKYNKIAAQHAASFV